MAKAEAFSFGAVDTRSNPLNLPGERSIRCRNFTPLQSGQLRLRYGFTEPTMTGAVDSTQIHSAAYYETFAGVQYILFGQGTKLKSMALATGVVTQLALLTNGNSWGHFRARNSIFLANGTDFKQFDGTTLRDVGIRAPNSTEASAVSVAAQLSPAGSFDSTTLTGYQLSMAYYNPNTGHVGNAVQVGARVTIPGSGYSLAVTGLPNLSGVNPEWQKILGRTPDGGAVPYWFLDGSGNPVVVNNTATSATIISMDIDTTKELPFRNSVPTVIPDSFTRVNTRVFGKATGNQYIRYSEDVADVTNANFVGNPEESWPADNIEAFPTGELPRGVHNYRFEGWFFSRNNLAVWSELLRQQGGSPWRGPWPAGLAGQRAFVETPYGPHWLTPDKQLMSFDGSSGGPTPASSEYENSLLAKISDGFVAQTELMYLRDPEKQIDRLYIFSQDILGNPLMIIHDFLLRDARSPIEIQGASGQAYEAIYSNKVPNTFVGSGYTPRQNPLDSTGRARLWTGSTTGTFMQLEDGTADGFHPGTDNAFTFTGDIIKLINLGPDKPSLESLQIHGDGATLDVSYSLRPLEDISSFQEGSFQAMTPPIEGRWVMKFDSAPDTQWIAIRLQLTAHPTDGNYDMTDPPFIPLPTYGVINEAVLMLGRTRPQAK